MQRVFFLLIIALILVLPVSAQDSPSVTAAHPLTLSSGVGARILPSPDAQWVAYDSSIRLNSHVDRYLTISAALLDSAPAYFKKPEDLPRGFDADANSPYLPFTWSPDSTRLAVTSQPLVTQMDTDLWTFDVASETWTNLADDGYTGSLTGEGGQLPPEGTIVDIQPAWSPDGTRIAVERTLIGADGQFQPPTYTLIDAQTGASSDLIPLPGAASTGATASLAWSPDGASLAAVLLHQTPDPAVDGLWLFAVADGSARQLATLAQITDALHGVLADLEMTSVGPVVWSPDSSKLLLWAGKTTGTPLQVWPFVVDAASGALTSAPIPAHPRDTAASRGLRPLQAAWSPDSQALMVFTFGLHPDEDKTSLDPAETSVRGGVRILDLATGANTLLGYLPLGKTPLYYAAWAADGQAIIDGYHLTLAG